tara:strand:- start:5936 stop:7030 length:1095 start_codon:yes stop_codon:yes gene_type:complete
MADTSYTTQIVREAPEIEAQKIALMEEARNLYNQPMFIPAVEAAGLSQTQQQAVDFAKQGVGAWEPYLQAASQGVTQGMDLTQTGARAAGAVITGDMFQQAQNAAAQGIGALQGSTGAYDPSMAVPYMNAYQQNVTQDALGEMRRQAQIASQGQAAQAIGAGAFGGTREGVQRAEMERNVQDQMNQRINQDYFQNWQQAQGAAMQGFEQDQQRQLARGQALGNAAQGVGALTAQQAGVDFAKASTLGQLGQGMAGMGIQYGAIGQTNQQLGAADAQLLSGFGAIEQQNAQAQLDAMRATMTQEAMAPYQQLGFVSDIYRGAPTTQMALTSQSAPTASPLQTAVGLGVGALTAGAGYAKATSGVV